MKPHTQTAFISWRFYLLCGFILLIVAGLVARIIDLSVIEQRFLQQQGDVRAKRTISEPAFRGMITDRNGYPLAISTSVYSVWVNPKEFTFNSEYITSLSDLLAMKPIALEKIIEKGQAKHRQFLYLKRELVPEIAKQIRQLKIPGVYLQQDYKRFYPEGEVASHVIGFTNVDDRGQEGLELAYNQWLSGVAGKRVVLKDRMGREISQLQEVQQQKHGSNLTLSIDRGIQYLAYRELLDGVQKNLATSGTVVVLDVKTGEILAMVNQPSFNPNKISNNQKEAFRNRAVTDIFEPGSTLKTFSVADALESGKYTPDSMIDTYPGWMRVEHHVVRDEHNKGLISLAEVLQYSSNVGITKVMLTLPPDSLWRFLRRMGFGEATGVEFPGEQGGRLVSRKTWKPFALATLSFGYGMSATVLQLAHAYATIANDGIKMPLTLLRRESHVEGERVIDSKLAQQMTQLLENVVAVKGGTGEKARVQGYHVAGKTGTARILGSKGYEEHHHVSSFIGFAPATNPRLVVAVVIHDPQGKYYFGADVSAPVFEKIMEGSLRLLNVPPDDLETVKS